MKSHYHELIRFLVGEGVALLLPIDTLQALEWHFQMTRKSHPEFT
jgi:hypothetical protein